MEIVLQARLDVRASRAFTGSPLQGATRRQADNPARSSSSASIVAVHHIRLSLPRSRRSRRLSRRYSACRGPLHHGLVASGGRIQIPPPVDKPLAISREGAGRGGGGDHVRGCAGEELSCPAGQCARRVKGRRARRRPARSRRVQVMPVLSPS